MPLVLDDDIFAGGNCARERSLSHGPTPAVPRHHSLKSPIGAPPFQKEESSNLFAYRQHPVAMSRGEFATTISAHGRTGQATESW
jgi:hypothetical protein